MCWYRRTYESSSCPQPIQLEMKRSHGIMYHIMMQYHSLCLVAAFHRIHIDGHRLTEHKSTPRPFISKGAGFP